jgi:hypothetical protein
MISTACTFGSRVARPSAKVRAEGALTAFLAANDNAVAGARAAPTPMTSHPDVHGVEGPRRAQQLERVSGDPQHQISMKRGHEVQPIGVGDPERLVPGLVEVAPELDDLGAEGLNGGILIG